VRQGLRSVTPYPELFTNAPAPWLVCCSAKEFILGLTYLLVRIALEKYLCKSTPGAIITAIHE